MSMPKRFRTLRPWLIESYGGPIHRVALDAGSTCPNRDGTRGRGGCFYCDVEGSGTAAMRSGQELEEQLERGLKRVAKRDPGGRVIAYFQSYSNTYVESGRFEEMLASIDAYIGKQVACVSVATRPDTLPASSIEVLRKLSQRVPVWVELGLEAADDTILTDINRLHSVAEFSDAVDRCHRAGLSVVGHVILGLPKDGRAGARRSAELLAKCGVAGVKVHQLMVLKRTQFAHMWQAGELETLDLETYLQWLADFVERLLPEQVLHRLTGDSPSEKLLAPHWNVHKNNIRIGLEAELERRGSQQGSLASEH